MLPLGPPQGQQIPAHYIPCDGNVIRNIPKVVYYMQPVLCQPGQYPPQFYPQQQVAQAPPPVQPASKIKDKKEKKKKKKAKKMSVTGVSSQPALLREEPWYESSDFRVKPDAYKRGKILGSGSYGTVFKGVGNITRWEAAIKELRSKALSEKEFETYMREIDILCKASGPFILKIYGFTLEAPYSIITEYMSTGSLWDILRDPKKKLTPTQKTNIALGIAHGMKYLHSKQIIHRDLKSPNILLDKQMLPVICDFGLGRVISPDMTVGMGTPQWMAPEQMTTNNYTYAVDVFAYGTILYELLTEYIPFKDLSTADVIRILHNGHRPLISASDQQTPLGELLYSCWKQDPTQRPTFEYIYQMFATGLVEFPGTDKRGVEQLLQYIRRYEKNEAWDMNTYAMDIVDELDKDEQIPQEELPHMIFNAASKGNIADLGKYLTLTTELDLNMRDGEGKSILHRAAETGQSITVEYITYIDGIDMNAVDGRGETALMIAARVNSVETVKTLASIQNIDMNMQNKDGNTALHIAVLSGSIDAINVMLLNDRIDKDTKNSEGKTAKQLAEERGIPFYTCKP